MLFSLLWHCNHAAQRFYGVNVGIFTYLAIQITMMALVLNGELTALFCIDELGDVCMACCHVWNILSNKLQFFIVAIRTTFQMSELFFLLTVLLPPTW